MSWKERFEEEGREFELDDRFVEVDSLLSEGRPHRSWAAERKPPQDSAFPATTPVSAQRLRAYWKALPHSLTNEEWKRWRAAFGKSCAYCGDGAKSVVIDHVLPIASGAGGTTLFNVLPACGHCNAKKTDMDPWRWFAIIGWEPFLGRLAMALEAMNEKA